MYNYFYSDMGRASRILCQILLSMERKIFTFTMNKKESELIRDIIAFQHEASGTLEKFSKGIKIPEKLNPNSEKAKSLLAIMGTFQSLTSFANKLLNIDHPKLEDIEKLLAESNIKQSFVSLDQNFPTSESINEIRNLKEIQQLERDTKIDFITYIQWPYKIAQRWQSFWTSILGMMRKEDPARASYQQCLSEFQTTDQEKRFKEL